MFFFSERLSLTHRRSVDLVGNEGNGLSRNVVNNTGLSFEPRFSVSPYKGSTVSVYGIFSISTDFNVYSRGRYSDSMLNKDNFVWNARLTYSAMKGNLLFMVDGFDILHNLSNVSYSVNAQARTETFTNVLPRYVMFHVQWKFHKLPKKR